MLSSFYFFGPVLWSSGLSGRHQDDCKNEYGCLNKDDISEFREFKFSAAGSVGPHIRVPLGCVPSFGNFLGLHDRDLHSPINGITVGIRGRIIAILGGLPFYTL